MMKPEEMVAAIRKERQKEKEQLLRELKKQRLEERKDLLISLTKLSGPKEIPLKTEPEKKESESGIDWNRAADRIEKISKDLDKTFAGLKAAADKLKAQNES